MSKCHVNVTYIYVLVAWVGIHSVMVCSLSAASFDLCMLGFGVRCFAVGPVKSPQEQEFNATCTTPLESH